MHPLKRKKTIHDGHPLHWKNIKKKKSVSLGFCQSWDLFFYCQFGLFLCIQRERERVSSQIIIMPIKHFASLFSFIFFDLFCATPHHKQSFNGGLCFNYNVTESGARKEEERK